MTTVLDASAAIQVAIRGVGWKELAERISGSDLVIAPDIFISEVTNAFWKYRNFSGFGDDICLVGIEFCVNLVDVYIDSKELWREAFFEGTRNRHSTYDMYYLVAARRNAAALVTRDETLIAIAVRNGVEAIRE